mgnify:FL=1
MAIKEFENLFGNVKTDNEEKDGASKLFENLFAERKEPERMPIKEPEKPGLLKRAGTGVAKALLPRSLE